MTFIIRPAGSTDPSTWTEHAEGTLPQEIAKAAGNYEVSRGSSWVPVTVTEALGAFDATPTVAPTTGVTVNSIADGWEIIIEPGVAGGQIVWEVTAEPEGTFTAELESAQSLAAGVMEVKRAANTALTSVVTTFFSAALTANTPVAVSGSHGPVSSGQRWIGLAYNGPSDGTTRTFYLRNATITPA